MQLGVSNFLVPMKVTTVNSQPSAQLLFTMCSHYARTPPSIASFHPLGALQSKYYHNHYLLVKVLANS